MKMMNTCPNWGRNPTVEDFGVLRQNAVRYRSMDILEAITYFRLRFMFLWLHLCSNNMIFFTQQNLAFSQKIYSPNNVKVKNGLPNIHHD